MESYVKSVYHEQIKHQFQMSSNQVEISYFRFPFQQLLGASRGAFQSILKTNFLIKIKEKSYENKKQAVAKEPESEKASAA